MPRQSRRSSLGARRPRTRCPSTPACPIRHTRTIRCAPISARCDRLYGHRARQEADGHRDRPRVHRLLHQFAHRGSARGRRRARRPRFQGAGTRLARLVPGEAAGRSRKGSTGSSAMPGSNGPIPVARCASASTATWSPPGERCASTTNRNFRGRQGPGARTHLMSPAMVAAAAVTGHLADVRPMLAGRKV